MASIANGAHTNAHAKRRETGFLDYEASSCSLSRYVVHDSKPDFSENNLALFVGPAEIRFPQGFPSSMRQEMPQGPQASPVVIWDHR